MTAAEVRPFAKLPRDCRAVLRDLPDADVKVLVMLILVKRQGEEIRAGHEMLEDITGVSMRTLRDVLPRLVAAGLITYTAGVALGRGRGRAPCRIRVLELPGMTDHPPVMADEDRVTENAGAINTGAINVDSAALQRLSNGSLTADIQEKQRVRDVRDTYSERDEHDLGAPALEAQHPAADADRWGYVRAEAWARNLIAAGCKIGSGSWPAWKTLCERWPLLRVIEISATVPATERFHGQVEEALKAAGTASAAAAVLKKTRVLDLSAK
jgi:DNA-binding IscR family transcriptional regulator